MCTQAAWLPRCYTHLASCLGCLDFVLQTAEFKDGLARSVQAAEWRKKGKGRGRRGCIVGKEEACPAVLRKPNPRVRERGRGLQAAGAGGAEEEWVREGGDKLGLNLGNLEGP